MAIKLLARFGQDDSQTPAEGFQPQEQHFLYAETSNHAVPQFWQNFGGP